MTNCSVEGCKGLASTYNASGDPVCSEHYVNENGPSLKMPRCSSPGQESKAVYALFERMQEFTTEEGGLPARGWFRVFGELMAKVALDEKRGQMIIKKRVR